MDSATQPNTDTSGRTAAALQYATQKNQVRETGFNSNLTHFTIYDVSTFDNCGQLEISSKF